MSVGESASGGQLIFCCATCIALVTRHLLRSDVTEGTATMSKHDVLNAAISRRQALRGAAGIGLGAIAAPFLGRGGAIAQDVSCPPAATPAANTGTPEPMSGKKIGVSVAYLSVPFYANFKTGL